MTDLNANITTILANLATAFGGHSQVPDEVVGSALHGQFTNNSMFRNHTTDEVVEVAAAQIAARWECSGADLAATRVRVVRGFNAARAALATIE